MNYHLMIDHWFINGFIDIAEKVAPKMNVYILTFDAPSKYVKFPLSIHAPYGSKEMDGIIGGIAPDDSLFIHWFHEPVMDVLNKIDKRVMVYLPFWGGDFIGYTKAYDKFNLDPLTKQYVSLQEKDRGELMLKNFGPRLIVRHLKLWSSKRSAYLKGLKLRRDLMRRINFFCHWNTLDLESVVSSYGGKPKFLNFFYEGGLDQIQRVEIKGIADESNNVVWLGNSDTATNNHLDAIQALSQFQNRKLEIICPLSYGSANYGDFITKTGKQVFGSNWQSLREFMPLDEYLVKQKRVDVVVMFHNRTQAGFNTFGFLKMGKKVFIKSQSTIFSFLRANGILVFDANTISQLTFEEFFEPLTEVQSLSNSRLITELFSEERKISCYKNIL